jgi:quinoprotein glucose dehydrogenase
MKRRIWMLTILASGSILAAQETPSRQVEWRFVGGDAANTKFSSLADIAADNLQWLGIAWQWHHWETRRQDYGGTVPGLFETSPVMIDGVLYVTTPYNSAAALDAETGKELWRFDGEAYKLGQIPGTGFKHRGAAVWRDGARLRLFLNSRNKLFSLDAETGKPVTSFGTNGAVSLTAGFTRPIVNEAHFSSGSPPLVYKDLVIVGHAVSDQYQYLNDTQGIVQAFDARTGKRMWVFNVIPQSPKDFGADTWEEDSWRFTGHANVWGTMTLDEARGLLYMPTSTPSSDYYGGRRPGANLFAESLVCVDAATGQRKWFFQAVRHGLWDYDFTAPPVLATITVNGKRIDAVAEVSKQGFTYVFDRVTGEPVWPILEFPVDTDSDVPGENVYPEQPYPTRPPPFAEQGVSLEDANDLTPQIKALAEREMGKYRLGPLFTPPSLEGTLQRPTFNGGSNWGGAAWDAESGYLFVRAENSPGLNRVGKNDGTIPEVDVGYSNRFAERAGPSALAGIPLTKPPYATITAIDLNKGAIAWQVPLGEGSPTLRNHPLLKGVTLPARLGSIDHNGPLVVASGLVFIGGGDKYLYAFDKKTGKELWRGALPYANTGNPVTYRTKSGRQFIVIATGAAADNALVAFAVDTATNRP